MFETHPAGRPFFRVLKIGLNINRNTLYERIDHRVDAMIAAVLVEEVEGLLENGYSADPKPMQAIGYRHIIQYDQFLHFCVIDMI